MGQRKNKNKVKKSNKLKKDLRDVLSSNTTAEENLDNIDNILKKMLKL